MQLFSPILCLTALVATAQAFELTFSLKGDSLVTSARLPPAQKIVQAPSGNDNGLAQFHSGNASMGTWTEAYKGFEKEVGHLLHENQYVRNALQEYTGDFKTKTQELPAKLKSGMGFVKNLLKRFSNALNSFSKEIDRIAKSDTRVSKGEMNALQAYQSYVSNTIQGFALGLVGGFSLDNTQDSGKLEKVVVIIDEIVGVVIEILVAQLRHILDAAQNILGLDKVIEGFIAMIGQIKDIIKGITGFFSGNSRRLLKELVVLSDRTEDLAVSMYHGGRHLKGGFLCTIGPIMKTLGSVLEFVFKLPVVEGIKAIHEFLKELTWDNAIVNTIRKVFGFLNSYVTGILKFLQDLDIPGLLVKWGTSLSDDPDCKKEKEHRRRMLLDTEDFLVAIQRKLVESGPVKVSGEKIAGVIDMIEKVLGIAKKVIMSEFMQKLATTGLDALRDLFNSIFDGKKQESAKLVVDTLQVLLRTTAVDVVSGLAGIVGNLKPAIEALLGLLASGKKLMTLVSELFKAFRS